jgi:hypothetical protein
MPLPGAGNAEAGRAPVERSRRSRTASRTRSSPPSITSHNVHEIVVEKDIDHRTTAIVHAVNRVSDATDKLGIWP